MASWLRRRLGWPRCWSPRSGRPDSPRLRPIGADGRRGNGQSRDGPADRVGPLERGGRLQPRGVADLAIGVPGENDVAGAVNVLYGAGGGLSGTGGRLFTQVGGLPERFDVFGFGLVAGAFNHDGVADLAAAAPLEDVGSTVDAGVVSVLPGSAGGLTASGRLFTQNSPGALGTAETFDLFGGLEIVF